MSSSHSDWFTVDRIDSQTFVLSEYRHWEETHCYLLNGRGQSLLIDTGLGVASIRHAVEALTDQPVTAVATHIHWDHIGGHGDFPFYAHAAELDWLQGRFPLPVQAVRAMLAGRCDLPEGFSPESYQLFQGTPARLVADQDILDIGGRKIQVLHTPGHSPGHLCFWDPAAGYLFTGDLVYLGELFANYPSTDPAAYLTSLEKVAALPVRRVFPGHHSLNIRPEILPEMRDAFRQLQREGRLRHGTGKLDCGSWSLWL